jgi:hypothetical protein
VEGEVGQAVLMPQSPSSSPVTVVRVRGLPLPSGHDHGRGAVVPGTPSSNNLRRGHDELGVDISPRHRLPATFAELTHAI